MPIIIPNIHHKALNSFLLFFFDIIEVFFFLLLGHSFCFSFLSLFCLISDDNCEKNYNDPNYPILHKVKQFLSL